MKYRLTRAWDEWRVLPHRSIIDYSLYNADGTVHRDEFEHAACGMSLTQAAIEENWCPHCCLTLNKAADRRAIGGESAVGDGQRPAVFNTAAFSHEGHVIAIGDAQAHEV